jgi:DNA-binding beta-propeller fold protein YncE
MKALLLTLTSALFSVHTYASEPPRYDDGARWAFISGQNTTQVAVIDTFDYKLAGDINLKAIPIEMVVSDVQDILVYIDGKTSKVYSYDLIKHTHHEMTVSGIPTDIVFHSDDAQLAVALKDKIEIIKPLKQEYVVTIEGLSSPFSMNFDNGGYNLYITENTSGNTTVYRAHDGKRTTIQLGDGQVSDITLSPDARLALVSDYKTHSVYVWDLFSDMLYNSYPMEAQPWRPYVSSDSEHMVFVAQNGQAQVFNTWSGEIVNSFKFEHAPKSIRTGWLETIGIVESADSLNIFELTESKPATQLPLDNPLNEVVVVSDSKTLFATQQNSSDLFIYDIRKKQQRSAINTGIRSPQHIVMGITNTVCH